MGWKDAPVVQSGGPAWASAPLVDAALAEPQRQPDEADRMAGSPATRFALGAASPFVGAFQLGANVGDVASEAMGFTPSVGKAVNEYLQRLEGMKRRGMTPATDLANLREGREIMARIPGEAAQRTVADLDRTIARIEAEGASADPQDAGFDTAGLAGAVLSPVALEMMAAKAAPTVIGRSLQGARMGGTLGASAPVTDTDDYGTAKATQIGAGTLIGGAIPPAMDAVRAVASKGWTIVDPMLPGGARRSASRLLAEAAGPRREAVEAALEQNRVFVPGAQPTAAEAAAPAGSAEFSGLQNIARRRDPSTYGAISRGQETARSAAVGTVAKDKATLAGAEAARSSEAGRLYGEAFEQATKSDPELAQLATDPFFRDAIPHAVKLAKSEGITAKSNLTRFLHYVKLGLDKELAKTGDTALSATEKGAVQQVKQKLVAWMGRKNPSYDAARTAFAEASKPINRMQVGQELEKALVKPIGEGERPGVFAGAVREAPRTLKRATGQPRFQELEEVLDRGEYETVKNVLADLSRKAEHTRLETAGAERANEITQAFSLPATGPLQQSYMIFKTVLGRISKGVNEKTLDEVANALQVPASALKLLRMAPDAKRAAVVDSIIQRKLGRGAIVAGTAAASEGAQQ